MKTAFEKIAHFNELIGNGKGNAGHEGCLTQLKMVKEEFEELCAGIHARDIQEIRDGIADVLVTVYGLAHRYGIDADADLEAVHASNMTKFLVGDIDTVLMAAEDLSNLFGIGVAYAETAFNLWALTSAYDQTGNNGVFYPQGKLLKPSTYLPPVFE